MNLFRSHFVFPFLIALAATTLPAQTPSAPAPATPPPGGAGLGDLLVAPTRLIISGNRRTAQVALINTGAQVATYRISVINLRMKPDGSVEDVQEATASDWSAEPLLRFSPRQVTLEPRVAQTVRIQVRKPADLKPGEYRSHLLFRGVPRPEDSATMTAQNAQGLTVQLTPVYGVSIPVIVRHGETAVKAALNGAHVTTDVAGNSTVEVEVSRDGNQSLYGNLTIGLMRAEGREQVIGELGGVAVYVPLVSRRIAVPIHLPKERAAGARLHLTFVDAERDEAGGDKLAEAYVTLP